MKTNRRRVSSPVCTAAFSVVIGLASAAALAAGPADSNYPLNDVPATPTPASPDNATVAATNDPLQQLLNDQKYSAAVKLASQQLTTDRNISENGAPAPDRFRVLMQKGEGLLGMHESYMAIDQFNTAVKATQDPREIALAKSAVELVRKSGGSSYVPKFAPPDAAAGTPKAAPIPLAGINLLDPDSRRPIFNALLDDELTAMRPRIHNAATARSLPNIYPVLQQVEDLAQLDTIANGDDSKTTSIASELLDHVRGMLASALKDMSNRLNDIEQYANQTNNYAAGYPGQENVYGGNMVTTGIIKKNGLSQSNKSELTDMIATCGKIHQAADAFGAIARTASANEGDNGNSVSALPPISRNQPANQPQSGSTSSGGMLPIPPMASSNNGEWTALGADADRLAGHAKDVLDTNYDNGSTAYSTQTSYPYGTGYGTNPYGGYTLPNGATVYPGAPTTPTSPTGNGSGTSSKNGNGSGSGNNNNGNTKSH